MGLVRDAGSFSKRQAVGRVNSLRGGESGAICSRGCFFYKDVGRTLTLYFNSNSGFHLGRTNKESNSKKSSARLQDCKTARLSLFFTLSTCMCCTFTKSSKIMLRLEEYRYGVERVIEFPLFNLSTYSSASGVTHFVVQ